MTFYGITATRDPGHLAHSRNDAAPTLVLVLTEAPCWDWLAPCSAVVGIPARPGLGTTGHPHYQRPLLQFRGTRFIIYPGSLLKGFCFGTIGQFISGIFTTGWEARSQPASVQQHSGLQLRVQRYLPLLTGCGLC